jgi:hypothetical protein
MGGGVLDENQAPKSDQDLAKLRAQMERMVEGGTSNLTPDP